jgi:6-phosphogluconolactonase/glucosamine-6-phosphate isomerase/deaminase
MIGLGRMGANMVRRLIKGGHRCVVFDVSTLNRSRRILWVVTGSGKVGMLARLRAGDWSIPAGRVRRDQALVLADRAAAGP